MEKATLADKAAFEGCVSVLRADGSLTFVEAVYRALDIHVPPAREKEGIQFACCRGCSSCCRQMVTCTSLEFDVIRKFIDSLGKIFRKMVLNNAVAAVKEWKKYYARNKQRLGNSPISVHQDWWGKNCPFLLGNACAIYEVRPIDCRTAVSTKICGTAGEGSAMRMHFDVELWANNMILEAEQRRSGAMQTTPLHHWLLVHFF